MIEVTPQERDAIFRQDFIAFFLKAFWAAHQEIVEDRHKAKPNEVYEPLTAPVTDQNEASQKAQELFGDRREATAQKEPRE